MPKFCNVRSLAGAAALAVLSALGPAAAAATVPFSTNFDSDTVGGAPAGFTAGGTAIYTITNQSAGDNALQASSAANSGSQGVSLTNVPGNPINLTSDVRLISFTDGGSGSANFGFGLFGSAADFSSGTQYRALVTTVGTGAGRIFLVRNGVNVAISQGGTPVALAANKDYQISVTATSLGAAGLYLYGSVTDGITKSTFDYLDATPLTGTFFGYRTATSVSGTTEVVQYDNFTATPTPEPGTAGLALGTGVMLAGRRRRRRPLGA